MTKQSAQNGLIGYLPHILVFAAIIAVGAYILNLSLWTAPNSTPAQPTNSGRPDSRSQAVPPIFQAQEAPTLPLDVQTAVIAVQALPTLTPSASIVFSGGQPESITASLPLDSIVAVSNKTDRPIYVIFSSGASMTLGAQGNLEHTLTKAGIEEVIFVDGEQSWAVSIPILGYRPESSVQFID